MPHLPKQAHLPDQAYLPDQGRARVLYDEQLQRLQQEKLVCDGKRPFLLSEGARKKTGAA